jgi:hypothetical protein
LTINVIVVMLWTMNSTTESSLGPHPPAYAKLLASLAHSGWLCQGTVAIRTFRRKVAGKWVDKGPYYLWTAKHQGKTIGHALSESQCETAKEAIEASRRVMDTVAKLQEMTLERISKKLPGVQKRK